MPSLNKMTVIGHLGSDPELRYTPSGKAVVNLSVPANDPVLDQASGEWKDNTTWIRATLWEEAAERAAERARKGNLVYVEGPIHTRQYTRSDGTVGFSVEMRRVNKFVLLERSAEAQADRVAAAAAAATGGEVLDVDDIPF